MTNSRSVVNKDTDSTIRRGSSLAKAIQTISTFEELTSQDRNVNDTKSGDHMVEMIMMIYLMEKVMNQMMGTRNLTVTKRIMDRR